MKKEDLIELKKSLGSRKTYSNYLGNDGSMYETLTEQQILQLLDTDRAVSAIISTLKNMIVYLSNQDYSYTSIAICPTFSVFADNEMISGEGIITCKNAILVDCIGITFTKGYVYSENNYCKIFPIELLQESNQIFYSKFTDFIVALNECGLKLDCVESFEDIRRQIVEKRHSNGKIAISFPKDKRYSK